MKRIITLILLIIFSNIFGQTPKDYFKEGFNEGYESTINDHKLFGYTSFADVSKCGTRKIYNLSIENDVENKQYSEGYRCGVKQALSDIPRIERMIESEWLEKSQQRNKSNLELQQSNKSNQNNFEQNNFEQNNFEQNKIQSSIRAEEERKNQINQEFLLNSQRNAYNRMQQSVNNLSNDMQSLSNTLMQIQRQNTLAALNERFAREQRFADKNIQLGMKYINFYNNLPQNIFNQKVTGIYEAAIFQPRQYSFSNGNSIQTFIPCLVEVYENKLMHIYPFGKKDYELYFPIDKIQDRIFKNGIITYSDFSKLENTSIVLIEPYITDSTPNHKVSDSGTGKVYVWSNKKKDENKEIFIQERVYDRKNNNYGGDIVNETKTKIIYAKNEKDINLDLYDPVIVDKNSMLQIIGTEAKHVPNIGKIALFYKFSVKDTKPLGDEDKRLIRIKKNPY